MSDFIESMFKKVIKTNIFFAGIKSAPDKDTCFLKVINWEFQTNFTN